MQSEKVSGSSSHLYNIGSAAGSDKENGIFLETDLSQQVDIQKCQNETVYLEGARFWLMSMSMAIMMFMTNLEVPVVTTALVAVTNDLQGFDISGWILSSYLLGYVAVIVICAKFSDILGRKFIFLLSTAIFIIFSAACSASQTMIQLIVFRAFQGIGGGGCFSLCTIMVIEIVPPEKYTKYVANISIVNALALLAGPIIGGAIAARTNWRWIFIINVPISFLAFFIAFVAIPNDFPYQNQPNFQQKGIKEIFSRATFGRVDMPGTILILFATVALTAAFEEADELFPWKSAYFITLLVASVVFWVALLLWERYVALSNKAREPILPWAFFTNRQMMGILLNFVFLGGPAIISMLLIPQRFQLIYGTSSLNAGVYLIPFTIALPAGTIFASSIAGRLKVPPIYMLLTGSCLQVIGFALLSTLPSTLDIPPRIYGFEFISGWGCGMNFSLLFVLIPFVNEKQYHAVGMGAGAQFRMIGSAIILSIATSVYNGYARHQLQDILGVSDTNALTQMDTFPQGLQEQIRYALTEAYNRQNLVLCASAAFQIPASLLMWKKKQIVV
ncbi:putative multidrug resistance protein fnx1 [Annulohypoxylon truncatum]|uniref:putative multidrug resistance protein fnx1 n=1 Tax=Annulohypoxylon truncatum TaxID=327061 RepID=UPI002008D26F|nr:putative multidrug resistance protein fnx1 [Annulohypoxylon truncatum]KAI1207295.1 putative multidrug resistance protein fnx1 [Annulohypoxylon truncatum]